MACRPASYSTLSLAEKELLCKKATAEPYWTLVQLMQWGTQQFKTPVKRSTLQGILKRKREYSDISEPLLSRKRRCPPHQRALDDRLLRKIEAYKSWHANATVSGALVIAIANRAPADGPRHHQEPQRPLSGQEAGGGAGHVLRWGALLTSTAMKWCSEGWDDVSAKTIRNCRYHLEDESGLCTELGK
jgi:hypothetical protein